MHRGWSTGEGYLVWPLSERVSCFDNVVEKQQRYRRFYIPQSVSSLSEGRSDELPTEEVERRFKGWNIFDRQTSNISIAYVDH